jgi:hypothetical protein
MYTLAADPQPWNGRGRWLAVLLVEPGHRDTIQMRHSMPQEAAKAGSSYSYVGRSSGSSICRCILSIQASISGPS